jgi:hypothetical protein
MRWVGESSSGGLALAPALRNTWRLRTPSGGMLDPSAREVRTGAGRSRTPTGGPRSRWLARSLPSSGTCVSGPFPKRGAGSGPLVRWGKGLTRGARLLRPLPHSYGWQHKPCLVAVEVGTPATGYRQWRYLFSFYSCPANGVNKISFSNPGVIHWFLRACWWLYMIDKEQKCKLILRFTWVTTTPRCEHDLVPLAIRVMVPHLI